ncbi:DUF1844 domain-containing protein [Synechococcus sp. Cruz CV-v-12]|uniref:DUF1844 domain-containing protein n=1 Tax=Synechococcus sp. Cruz CV-v-12 TaxID=2823728 RepID=UPI0020CF3C93|nr:DUF1844 domain-containing protein [Synechococcus sp. Cruz CV-v-12]
MAWLVDLTDAKEHIAYSYSMSDQSEQPKLIIDSDWKNQAQAEKDRLAAKEAEAKASGKGKSGAAGGVGVVGGGPGPDGQELPEADFQALLGTMVSQALMYMGAFPDPETGRAVISLEYARLHIDLLAVLEEKTKGNLTADEAEGLTQVISELRLRYVEISKAVAKHMAENAGKPGGVPGVIGGRPGAGPAAGPKLVF